MGLLAKDMAQVRSRRNRAGAGRARARLVERMGALHGLPQKIGQILSLGEISAPEQTYTSLTECRGTLPAPEAFAEMEKCLGAKLSECFRTIEEEGISASLGQVHRAVLPDGRPVAVKIQYPGMAEALRLDLRALGWLTAPVGGLKRGFDLRAYQREVGAMLQEELDYRHEAEMIRIFAARTAEWEEVRVPTVIDELSGDRILTMTWVEGEPISAARHWPLEERRKLAACLLRLFLTSCFAWGYLHSDPHPGNYRFARSGGKATVGWLDFGCVKKLEAGQMQALAGLVGDVLDGRARGGTERVLARYLGMGFNRDLLTPMAHLLAPLSEVLFEPFGTAGEFSLLSWNLSERVGEILHEFRWNFRFAGPANLIFFMRAYQGLIQYLQVLDAPVNWQAALEEAWKDQEPASEPEPRPLSKARLKMKSEKLRIRITEANRTKVDLTFRAAVAENLPDLVPPELCAKLAERSIDVEKIAREVVARDFEPAELFQLQEGEKGIRVWLE